MPFVPMFQHQCSICGWGTNDRWQMLTHRDTHRDDPEVKRRTAEMTALLARIPASSGAGTGGDE